MRVSVTGSQLADIREEAYRRGISVSAMLHGRLMGARPTAAVDAEVAKELGRIGNNLNQMTHHLHMGLRSDVTMEELRPLQETIGLLRLILIGGRP